MEVKIIETIPIRPHHVPFSQDHSLPLSTLDTDPNLDHPIRYVRFYANNPTTTAAAAGGDHRPTEVIAAALSRALVHYYPLAGQLRFQGSRLESFCSGDELALPLVSATVNATLALTVGLLEDPAESGFVDRLAPEPGNLDELQANPFTVQITMFECGGYALGTTVHHALCDGMGATQFFSAVAELARGAGRVSVEPVWERVSLLRPRDNPRVEGLVREVLLGGDGDGSVGPVGGVHKVVRECFDVKEEWLENFKKLLGEKSGTKFTTFEALGAFIWRAKVKASGVPPNESVKFAYFINIRKSVQPQLPTGYWGNGCVPMYVQLQAQDLLDRPIWETAELIKQSKRNVQDYVASFLDSVELHHLGRVKLAGSGTEWVSGFTDWRHLDHSGLDFGWGGPVLIYPLPMRLLGSDEPCFFLPAAVEDGGGGFKVMVMLREDSVDGFRAEVEKFRRQEF